MGCGKTLVALLSVMLVVGGGEQAAFLAPTELLARQHAENAARLLEPLGVRMAFLSGSVTGEPRALLLQALAAGEVDLLFGTHALFSEEVTFQDLGLVIVDEQHKFGVLQRQALLKKGTSPDLLLMTATPIPRTLALTAFGDLDVSSIRTMPAGRKPVITHLAREGNEQKVYRRVREEIEKGSQAYFVYPLIEESEALDVKDAESAFRALQENIYPDIPMALIHSRVPEEEKEAAMAGSPPGGEDPGGNERRGGGRGRGQRHLHGGRARRALRPFHAAPAAGKRGPRGRAVVCLPRLRREAHPGRSRAAEDHDGDHRRVCDRGTGHAAARARASSWASARAGS